MTRSRALGALGAALLLMGGFFSTGAPRLTLLNTSLRIEFPTSLAAAALAAAAGSALLAWACPWRVGRLLCAALVAGALLGTLHLALYRLDATDAGIVSRGLLGSTAIAWRDVSRVSQGPDLVLIAGRESAEIKVDTTDFAPEQRASLERTIARRVRESAPRPR